MQPQEGVPPTVAVPPALAAPLKEADASSFHQAVELVRSGRYGEAEPLLAALLARDPLLQDYYLYYLGTSRAHTGETDDAIEILARLRATQPASVWVPKADLEIARLHIGRGDFAAAQPYLTLAINAPFDESTAQEARLEQARLAAAQGQTQQAAGMFSALREAKPGSAVAKEARAGLQSLRSAYPDLVPRGAEWLKEGRLLLAEGDAVAAEKAARAAQVAGDSPEAIMLLADALKAEGAPAAATSALGTLVDRYPQSALAAPALYKMAVLFWNRDEDVPAQAAFEEYLLRYPNGASAAGALYATGRIQQSQGQAAEALASYQRLARQYPRAKETWDARWRIGWIHYRNRRYAEAASSFDTLAAASDAGAEVADARYWQARALERLGRVAVAEGIYRQVIESSPTSYYSGLAEKRLGINGGAPQAISPPPPPALPAAPPSIDRYHLIRYQALRTADLPHLARLEMRALERQADDQTARYFILVAYLDADAFPSAWRVAHQIGTSNLPDELRERLTYPVGWWPIIAAESRRDGVDPLLVLSVIRQESFFDPEARSSADARGLMQMTLPAARHEAAALGWSGDPSARLYDPEVNLPLGVHHLRTQLDRWNGDLLRALAAYNGGTTAVEKWNSRFGDLEPDEWVESITYRETRDYVKRVLTNYRAYSRIYGAGTSASAS